MCSDNHVISVANGSASDLTLAVKIGQLSTAQHTHLAGMTRHNFVRADGSLAQVAVNATGLIPLAGFQPAEGEIVGILLSDYTCNSIPTISY